MAEIVGSVPDLYIVEFYVMAETGRMPRHSIYRGTAEWVISHIDEFKRKVANGDVTAHRGMWRAEIYKLEARQCGAINQNGIEWSHIGTGILY